jgi:hypothetical protein
MYKYTYPIARNLRLTTTVESDVQLATAMDVMAFYGRQVSADDYDQIIASYRDDPSFHDCSDIKFNIPPREQCRYWQLIGCIYYGGMEVIGENHYRIYIDSN